MGIPKGIIGVIVGGLLTLFIGYLMEIHKGRILRRNTKFTTYYAKQVEVYGCLFSLINELKRDFNSLSSNIEIKEFFKYSKEELSKVKFSGQNNVLMSDPMIKKGFDEICFKLHELKTLGEDQAFYLDDEVLLKFQSLKYSLSDTVKSYELYSNPTPPIEGDGFAYLIASYKKSETEIEDSMILIKTKGKQIVKG